MSESSPLSGVQRKLDFGAVRSPFDPNSEVRRASQQSDLITATEIVRVPFFTRRPVAFCD